MRGRLVPLWFLLPALLTVGALVLWPLVQTVALSLTNYNPRTSVPLSTGLRIERDASTGELSVVVEPGSPAEEAGLGPETLFDGLVVPADPRRPGSRERLERFRGDPQRRLGQMRRRLADAESAVSALPAADRHLTLWVASGGTSREVKVRFARVRVPRIPPPDLGLSAALVSGEWCLVVQPGSVAARAGLTAADTVVALQGEPLGGMGEFSERLAVALAEQQRTGGDVVLEVRRGETTRAVTLPGHRGALTLDPPPAARPEWLQFVGLWNYARILIPGEHSVEARAFYRCLTQTVLWTVVNVSLHFVIGLGLALLLNRDIWGRVVYRVVLMLPWAVPVFVSAFVWRFLFNSGGAGQQGLVNTLLGWVGVDPIPWLSATGWTLAACIVVNVWLGVPFMMVTLLGGLQSIPHEMYEAARVDGATAWGQFRHVTLPLLKPVAVTATLLGVIWTFNMFNVIYLVQGREGRQVEILATLAFRRFYEGDYGLAAAYGVIILALLLVFAALYLRALRASERVWQ